jgi:hypothetical protein
MGLLGQRFPITPDVAGAAADAAPGPGTPSPTTVAVMCRNITTLRGLQPVATDEEIEAAARQYVRKVSGVQKPSEATGAAFERAVAAVTAATHELLDALPPRKVPPKTEPPLRRIARVRATHQHEHDHAHPHTHDHQHQPA